MAEIGERMPIACTSPPSPHALALTHSPYLGADRYEKMLQGLMDECTGNSPPKVNSTSGIHTASPSSASSSSDGFMATTLALNVGRLPRGPNMNGMN